MIQKGQKLTKTRGKGKGSQVTVVDVIDQNFVLVKDDKGKENRCNAKHLE